MMERLLINANATTAFSLQALLSIITAAGSLLLVLPSYMDANMMTGLPSHANLGSCSNSYRTDTAQRIGLVHDWRSHIGCCDGPDDCLQGDIAWVSEENASLILSSAAL